MLIPSLSHMYFFHFSDTCYIGSNGSTKFLESTVVFDSFWRATLALVLECYGKPLLVSPSIGVKVTTVSYHWN
jgi:hypothetical protein